MALKITPVSCGQYFHVPVSVLPNGLDSRTLSSLRRLWGSGHTGSAMIPRDHLLWGVCSDLNLEGPSSAHPARALARVLCTQGSGSAFSLQENAIGDEGASAVASALKVNTALTAL